MNILPTLLFKKKKKKRNIENSTLFQLSQFTLFIGFTKENYSTGGGEEYRNFREWLSMAVVSMPFVPEDTAKECNKKPRVQKKRERGDYSREKCQREKRRKKKKREKKKYSRCNNTATRTPYETPPLSKVSLLIFYVCLRVRVCVCVFYARAWKPCLFSFSSRPWKLSPLTDKMIRVEFNHHYIAFSSEKRNSRM